MYQPNEPVNDSASAFETNFPFDATSLEAIYRIVRKSMNGRKKVAYMDVDDLAQEVLLCILNSKNYGREKLKHWGLVKAITVNFVRRAEAKASRPPRCEPLPEVLPARRRPDELLMREFLAQAEQYLNDSHLELLALCLEKGYRLDLRADREDAARDLGISLDHLRHVLDKLRFKHGEFWRQYLSLL